MPSNVRKFLWLNCISLALGVAVAAIMDSDLAAKLNVSIERTVLIQVVTFTILLLFIWLVSRRKNWARWLWLALFVIGLPGYFAIFRNIFGLSLQGAISLFQLALQIAALYLIFTGDAQNWFKKNAGPT